MGATKIIGQTRAAIRAAGFAVAAMLPAGAAHSESAFGCHDLMRSGAIASLEGAGGQFFRFDPDLHADHRLADAVVRQLGELSAALDSRGTRLIFVPVPTKALVMPDLLPPAARGLGYDPDVAAAIYFGMLEDLGAAGVTAVDARRALIGAAHDRPPFFVTDPRLTAAGAEALAEAIVAQMAAAPGFARLPKKRFRTDRAVDEVLVSQMRLLLQDHCTAALPPLIAEHHRTTTVSGGEEVGRRPPSELPAHPPSVYLVTDEIVSLPYSNLAGSIAQRSGLETAIYNVDGGGAFAAISTYLTSQAFQDTPPAFLVWLSPVWNDLARFGDQPMRELIAAAGATCDTDLEVRLSPEGALLADLSRQPQGTAMTLRVDAAAPARLAAFEFRSAEGRTRRRTVTRHPGQEVSGRFFMPLSALWPDGAESVAVSLDVPFGEEASMKLCGVEAKS